MSTRTEIKYESKIQGKESEKIRYLATAGNSRKIEKICAAVHNK